MHGPLSVPRLASSHLSVTTFRIPPYHRELARAYDDQRAYAAASGWRQSGWKAAATNKEAQQRRGVGEPLYGRLFAERTYSPPSTIDASLFAEPYLEIEFAFRMSRNLPPAAAGVVYSTEKVADCIGEMLLAIEIVGGPPADWRTCMAAPLVASNVAHGATVLGRSYVAWRAIDLAAVQTTLVLDGEERMKGSGAAVLGNPLHAVAWLANRLTFDGEVLAAGEVVLSGTTIPVVPLGQAGRVEARFSGLDNLIVDLRR